MGEPGTGVLEVQKVAIESIWEFSEMSIERWMINPHPAYRLGFGRVSCATCIFGNPNQWATVRYLFPEQFTEIAELEAEFGHTIHFSYDKKKNIVPDSVVERSDRGQIYQSCLEHPEWVVEAKVDTLRSEDTEILTST